MSNLQDPTREWDPDRPVLAGLLARREELLASYVDLSDGVARFTSQRPDSALQSWVHPAPATRTAQSALASLAAIPRAEVEPFDLATLIAEQVTEAEQVMAALRDESMTFEIPVHTHAQPLVRIEMPPEGIDVYLSIQVAWQPLRAKMLMPMTADPSERGVRFGWSTGHVPRGGGA